MAHGVYVHGLCLYVLIMTMSPAKTAEPIEVPFGGNSYRPKESYIRWTVELSCMAVMQAVATFTVAICYCLSYNESNPCCHC